MIDNLRKFDYGVEDERFIITYEVDNIYSVVDKLNGTNYIIDNVDCDMTPTDLLQMLYDQLEDEI